MSQFLNRYTIKAKYKLGTGKTFGVNDVDITLDTIRVVSHGYSVGDALGATTSGSLPTGLSVDTAYYVIDVDASTIKLATSRANAFAGTAIDLTAVGSGTQTLTKNAIGVILSGMKIPQGHLITNSAYDVVTTCTTAGTNAGTMAISVEAANDIVTATAVSTGTTWNNVTNMVAGTPVSAATAIKTTADREVTFTLATNAFTAGEVNIYLDVIPSE